MSLALPWAGSVAMPSGPSHQKSPGASLLDAHKDVLGVGNSNRPECLCLHLGHPPSPPGKARHGQEVLTWQDRPSALLSHKAGRGCWKPKFKN